MLSKFTLRGYPKINIVASVEKMVFHFMAMFLLDNKVRLDFFSLTFLSFTFLQIHDGIM